MVSKTNSGIPQLLIYLLRWQFSTPLLAVVTNHFADDYWQGAFFANLIGGLTFFLIDRRIFRDS